MLKLFILFSLFAVAQTLARDIPSTIIAMERAALDRSDKGDANGFLEISDPGVVYIDPGLDKPIYGLENLRRYYQSFGTGSPTTGEMTNANVQVLGEVAVLTFNYGVKGGPPQWNATEVYRLTKNGWRIVHTHWAFYKPQKPK